MHLRFTTFRLDADSLVPEGLFTAAYRLRDEGRLDAYETAWFRDVVGWFEHNVPVPKPHQMWVPRTYENDGRAIFWFLADAHACIQHMRALEQMLRYHGVGCRTLRSEKPGLVIYRDHLQVAALPWRDTPR